MTNGVAPATPRRPVALFKFVRDYFFPIPDVRTDRLVRRLVVVDFIFLIYASVMAQDSRVILTAILAGNAVGAIGGLLFAVPKQSIGLSQSNASPGITGNTSLEEVSDWLTKTIIGAGLVSWRQILEQLDISGRIVGQAFASGDPNVALAGGVAVILASSALGALIGYLWFARHWPGELAHVYTATQNIMAAAGLKQEASPVAPSEPNLPPPPPAETISLPPAGERGEEAGKAAPQPSAAEAFIRLQDAARLKYARMRSAPLFHYDWARGMFGKASSISNKFGTRSLSASVRKLDDKWFEVSLELRADPKPATEAIFFLHNTFAQPTPTVGFDEGGVARLKVTAYGAFTVGALTDDGETELELNLAQLDWAPSEFRNR